MMNKKHNLNVLKAVLPIVAAAIVACTENGADYGRLAEEEISGNAEYMGRTYGCQLMMTGGGFIGRINKLAETLNCPYSVTVDEARRIFVDGSERLIGRVNSLQKLVPFLKNGALTIDEIEYSIHFSDRDHPYGYKDGRVSVVFSMGSKLVYATTSEARAGAPLVIIYEEPYEEARRIVSI